MQKYVNLIAFLQKLISKEHVIVIMESPDWDHLKKYNIGRPYFMTIIHLRNAVSYKCNIRKL